MDILEYVCYKLGVHTTERALGTTLVQNFVVAVGLQHRHVVLLLVLTNLTAHTHALCQQLHQLVVKLVNLLTQLGDTLGSGLLVADNQQAQNVVKYIWCYLLLGIAPSLVRIAVALHNQTVETKVHSLLAQRCNQLAATTNVTWVADDRQLRNTAT